MTKFSRKEIRRMLKTKSCPHNAPLEVHKELERQRRELNRKALSPKKEMHKFLEEQYGARPYRVIKEGSWEAWFRKVLIGRRQSKFINLMKRFLR